MKKLILRKAARLVEDNRVQIGLQRDLAGLKCGVGGMMPGFKTGIEMEFFNRKGAFAGVPAVGQQDSAHVEKDYVEGEHRRLSRCAAQLNLG